MKKPVKKTSVKKQAESMPQRKQDKVRFWILLALLVLSIALAWLINSGLDTALTDQFGS